MKKKSGLRNTIILGIVLLATVGALWWLLSTQENAVNKKLVFHIKEAAVESIEVTKTDAYGNPQHYTVRREGPGSWKLEKPFADIVNVTTVTNMVKVFEKFEAESTITDAKDLSEFGLDKPELTVKIGYGKRSKTLCIGTETPFPGSYYAKFEDKPEILVINSSVRTYLNNDMNTVRERKILEIDAGNVKQLEIRNRNKPVYLLVNENGSWTLESPFKERMTSVQTNQIINSLNVLTADDIVDNVSDPKAYGLDNPEYFLKLVKTDGSIIVVKANKVDSNYFVSNSLRPMSVFMLGSSTELDWQYDPDTQVDKRLVIYSQSQVQSVKYQRQGETEQELKGDALNTIWVSFSQLNATGFHYVKPHQPATTENLKALQPVYRYTCAFTTPNAQELVLSVYPAGGSEYFVTSSERPFVLKINKSDIDNLNEKVAEALKGNK